MAASPFSPGRTHQPREMRLVSEFMESFFPRARKITRVRLGPSPSQLAQMVVEPEEERLLKVFTRWADGVAIEKDRVHIIEGKIRPRMGPTEALEVYRRLWPSTPEFAVWSELPVTLHFWYAIEDPVLTALAREKGIQATLTRPKWLDSYMAELQPRERRATIQEVP